MQVKKYYTTLVECKSNSNSWQGEKGRARRAGASKSGTVRKMKMYREQVSCVVARGDIAVAVVMKDSPVWSCHGDGTQGAESQQEAAGETGHNRDRKSTSALMGTYRSLRRRAVQEQYTITTHNTTLHAYADLKRVQFSQTIFSTSQNRIAILSLRVQNTFCATLANGR